MNSNYRHLILLLILYITALISYGCGRAILSTPSPTELVATQTPAPKPTVTKTSALDNIATANFIETASINTIMSTMQLEVLETHSSPDGEWKVEIIRYECVNYAYPDYTGIIAYEQLKIVNLSNGTEKIVEDQLLNCDGVGAFGFDGLYWSPSSLFFYYSDWREGSPDGGCGNYMSLPIYRLDTLSQEIIKIGGSHISPDRTKLAIWEGKEIVIWDLDKGEIARIQGLALNAVNGAIAWSPDGQSLVYLQTTFDCAPDYGTTYVIRLDLEEMSQTLLLKFQPPGFGGVSWDVPDQITLVDGAGKQWNFDPKNRNIIPILTPTVPVPAGVFALNFYPPLIMEYDASEWKMMNYLQARNLKTCAIGEQGPTGDFPATPKVVHLDSVRYQVITFTDSPPGSIIAYYIEDNSLIGFNYEMGTSVLVVRASSSDWDRCKVLAEKVLSTLRVP